MKDYKVGEEFQFGKVKVRVEEKENTGSCEICIFKDSPLDVCDAMEMFIGACNPGSREDGKNVYFVKVE